MAKILSFLAHVNSQSLLDLRKQYVCQRGNPDLRKQRTTLWYRSLCSTLAPPAEEGHVCLKKIKTEYQGQKQQQQQQHPYILDFSVRGDEANGSEGSPPLMCRLTKHKRCLMLS